MSRKFKTGDRVEIKTGAGFSAGAKGVITGLNFGEFDYAVTRDNTFKPAGFNEWEIELLNEKKTVTAVSPPVVTSLYHWHSEALARYSDGHIIVVAESVTAARALAVSEFEAYVKSPDQYYWFVNNDGEFVNEDDYEEYLDLLKKFEEDIADEPLPNKGVVFVRGSE